LSTIHAPYSLIVSRNLLYYAELPVFHWVKTKLKCLHLHPVTASTADRNTAPAVMATLDLFTVNGLFQSLNAATDLVSFRNSTFDGQDICNLFLMNL